jgi:hypothetical protein
MPWTLWSEDAPLGDRPSLEYCRAGLLPLETRLRSDSKLEILLPGFPLDDATIRLLLGRIMVPVILQMRTIERVRCMYVQPSLNSNQ